MSKSWALTSGAKQEMVRDDSKSTETFNFVGLVRELPGPTLDAQMTLLDSIISLKLMTTRARSDNLVDRLFIACLRFCLRAPRDTSHLRSR